MSSLIVRGVDEAIMQSLKELRSTARAQRREDEHPTIWPRSC